MDQDENPSQLSGTQTAAGATTAVMDDDTARLHQLHARQPDRVGIALGASRPRDRQADRVMIKVNQPTKIGRPERDVVDVLDNLGNEWIRHLCVSLTCYGARRPANILAQCNRTQPFPDVPNQMLHHGGFVVDALSYT